MNFFSQSCGNDDLLAYPKVANRLVQSGFRSGLPLCLVARVEGYSIRSLHLIGFGSDCSKYRFE